MSALHNTSNHQAQGGGQSVADARPAADSLDVDAAITRVLEAEQAARERVAECESEALAVVQRAREQARRIAARAAQRTARVHACVSAALVSRLADVESRRPSSADAAGLGTPEDPRITAVTERLARELAGGDR